MEQSDCGEEGDDDGHDVSQARCDFQGTTDAKRIAFFNFGRAWAMFSGEGAIGEGKIERAESAGNAIVASYRGGAAARGPGESPA